MYAKIKERLRLWYIKLQIRWENFKDWLKAVGSED